MQLLLHRRKCSHHQLCAMTASKLVALVGHNENVACTHRIDVVHSVAKRQGCDVAWTRTRQHWKIWSLLKQNQIISNNWRRWVSAWILFNIYNEWHHILATSYSSELRLDEHEADKNEDQLASPQDDGHPQWWGNPPGFGEKARAD